MKFSYTKNSEIELFFIKESKSNKKIWRLGGEGVGVARVSVVVFFFFFQKNPRIQI